MQRKISIALATIAALAVAGASSSVHANSIEENNLQRQQSAPQEQIEDSTQPQQCPNYPDC